MANCAERAPARGGGASNAHVGGALAPQVPSVVFLLVCHALLPMSAVPRRDEIRGDSANCGWRPSELVWRGYGLVAAKFLILQLLLHVVSLSAYTPQRDATRKPRTDSRADGKKWHALPKR